MRVLSLFNGMSCGEIALRELGVIPEIYYSSEIDKYAIAQTQLNFPGTIQLGDVTKWSDWPVDWYKIDLLLAGSPCQGFSFAGKQLAFDDPRSKLFFVFVEILNHIKKFNPNVKFLLENVNMKKDHLRVISEYVGVFPVNINSNLVSAQNRDRWYWTNIQTKKVGLFDEVYSDIQKPKDRGILLKDILESEVEEKYFLSDKMLNHLTTEKNRTPTDINKKSACFTAGAHSGGAYSDMDLIACIRFGRSDEGKQQRKTAMRNGKDHTPFQSKEIVGLSYDKMNTVTCATTKDNLVMMQIAHGFNKGGEVAKNGKTPPLTKSSYEQNNLLHSTSRIRRLTPTECARLQTIPAWYKWQCSDTQQYRMLGNGWTVEVIKHILSFLK